MSSANEHERFGSDQGPFESRQEYLRRLARELVPHILAAIRDLEQREGKR